MLEKAIGWTPSCPAVGFVCMLAVLYFSKIPNHVGAMIQKHGNA
jgi:hypothetical protein